MVCTKQDDMHILHIYIYTVYIILYTPMLYYHMNVNYPVSIRIQSIHHQIYAGMHIFKLLILWFDLPGPPLVHKKSI